MPDELLERLRRFHDQTFPGIQERFQALVEHGQHPTILFIGCSDSRLVPYLLTGTGPGELFIVRNVAAFVPPHDGMLSDTCNDPPQEGSYLGTARRWTGYHGTAAAIEFAVLNLQVTRIVVCGHSHCGGIRALYEGVPVEAINLKAWLDLGREAVLPVRLFAPEASPHLATLDGKNAGAARHSPSDGLRQEVLRRTEQRAVMLQLERLMSYPMVRSRVEAGHLTLHGWHYVIEDGEVHILDIPSGRFVPASSAEHSGIRPGSETPDHML
ncbi:carbonic anhydrase [Hylemonella sp. W303a]|uniref:carbonic anhydrase n=1 Tax=Hylemonella sp. W303a TaxID=3389873 RepID=UPI00396B3924